MGWGQRNRLSPLTLPAVHLMPIPLYCFRLLPRGLGPPPPHPFTEPQCLSRVEESRTCACLRSSDRSSNSDVRFLSQMDSSSTICPAFLFRSCENRTQVRSNHVHTPTLTRNRLHKWLLGAKCGTLYSDLLRKRRTRQHFF